MDVEKDVQDFFFLTEDLSRTKQRVRTILNLIKISISIIDDRWSAVTIFFLFERFEKLLFYVYIYFK